MVTCRWSSTAGRKRRPRTLFSQRAGGRSQGLASDVLSRTSPIQPRWCCAAPREVDAYLSVICGLTCDMPRQRVGCMDYLESISHLCQRIEAFKRSRRKTLRRSRHSVPTSRYNSRSRMPRCLRVLNWEEGYDRCKPCSGMLFQCHMSRAPLEAERTHLKLTGVVFGGGANARRTAVDKEETYGPP